MNKIVFLALVMGISCNGVKKQEPRPVTEVTESSGISLEEPSSGCTLEKKEAVPLQEEQQESTVVDCGTK